jgi:subtilisin
MRFLLAALALVLLPSTAIRPASAADEVAGAGQVRAAAKSKQRVRVIATLSAPSEGGRIASPESLLRSRMAGAGVSDLARLGGLPAVAVELDPRQLEALLASGLVVSVHEDRRVRPHLKQSVPLVQAPVAWGQGATGEGQVVAILDTGVDSSHPFLKGKVVSEACFSQNYAAEQATSLCKRTKPEVIGKAAGLPCPSSVQDCEHGTHMAGIVAGKNAKFSGVAPGAKLIAIQVYSLISDPAYCQGSATCVAAYESDIISALEHVGSLASTYSIAAANLSLGGGTYPGSDCDASGLEIKAAIDGLRAKGIATVIASGNEYQRGAVDFPGCISSAITVAATTDYGKERITDFSNMSPAVDLLAPGDLIQSSVPGNKFASFMGTSMATPHVAGAWTVLKSANPAFTVDSIEQALESTGKGMRRSGQTRSRIDIAKALASLKPAAKGKKAAPGS